MTSSARSDDVTNPLIEPRARKRPAKAESSKAANGRQADPGADRASADGPEGKPTEGEAKTAVDGTPIAVPDFERLAANAARFIEAGGRALSSYLKPFETGEAARNDVSETLAVAAASIGKVVEHWTGDPARMAEAQQAIAAPFVQLWAQTYRRLQGEKADPVVPIAKGDKRYLAPEWQEMPLYEFLRQAHAIGTAWIDGLVEGAKDIDPATKAKARFYLRQITSATSPANFIATNPELMRATWSSSGENLVRGAALLAEDMQAGNGQLRIRQTDSSKFKLGENIAATPGKVVYRNDLIELIQYAPATEKVLRRPLLIVPPWINKFYILDLGPDKSFVKWAVEQGITVFLVSWVNPDARHRTKTFEAYMREGIFDALDAVERATDERQVNAIGYCVGGTLLSATLAYMAAKDDDRIASATFFAAQADFTDAGEIQVFIDEPQIAALESQMAEVGYLDGAKMAMAFNMLRPTDLLWSYVVGNYMKGEVPKAFDLLYWNSDSTRLPALNHSFYLRNFYLQNKLAKGEMELGGVPLDLGQVTLPVYSLATKEDHIAPAASIFRGIKLFGGAVRFVVAGSGHIAGVINPPAKEKYGYQTGGRPFGTLEDWLEQTVKEPGSWWPDWFAWLEALAPERTAAREPGGGVLPSLGDAPGSYVRVKS